MCHIHREESGFSLVELLVVISIMGVVLAMIASSLISMSNTENRGQALITNEQNANFALIALARDLRAANPLQPLSTAAAYASTVQMSLGPSSGPQTTVQWVFDSTAKTLSRSVVGSGAPPYIWLRGVLNSPSQPLLIVFDRSNIDLIAQGTVSPVTIATCTTRVEMHIAGLSQPGPLPFNVVADVQLRNQIANLAAQGGAPCA
jgi:prepilin-type N-terminal cleavage/methylation domain-containing protein